MVRRCYNPTEKDRGTINIHVDIRLRCRSNKQKSTNNNQNTALEWSAMYIVCTGGNREEGGGLKLLPGTLCSSYCLLQFIKHTAVRSL